MKFNEEAILAMGNVAARHALIWEYSTGKAKGTFSFQEYTENLFNIQTVEKLNAIAEPGFVFEVQFAEGKGNPYNQMACTYGTAELLFGYFPKEELGEFTYGLYCECGHVPTNGEFSAETMLNPEALYNEVKTILLATHCTECNR